MTGRPEYHPGPWWRWFLATVGAAALWAAMVGWLKS
jgi:hypothetical protein